MMLSLLFVPRAATIVLREDNCHFLRVDKEDFNRILRVRYIADFRVGIENCAKYIETSSMNDGQAKSIIKVLLLPVHT